MSCQLKTRNFAITHPSLRTSTLPKCIRGQVKRTLRLLKLLGRRLNIRAHSENVE